MVLARQMCVRRIASDGGTIAIVERSRLLAPFGLTNGVKAFAHAH